ncbi:hypothetical protein NMG60_11004147 [Bertholletia excelsa]
MYGGGAGKLGRGGGAGGRGGGGAGKRQATAFHHPAPPLHRPSAPSGRLSVGVGGAGAAPRQRSNTAGPTTSIPSAAEESFSLVTGNPLDFAMIIRLAPDLVDEIRRVEEQGGTARIKFDANDNNTSGNVINVGSKDFRFTWSREMGDLCDIYEERRSGEDGNGLLVESGCAWRKLNVQRILDESTKNHVKMRSEEAERKSKSRKAIILDHGNPSMKSQMKALAAAEANSWRKGFKQKKEPDFKKRKIETPPVTLGGPSKPAYKSGSGFPSSTPVKGRPSVSPVPSPPGNSGAPASPIGTGNLIKGHTSGEDNVPVPVKVKEKAISSDKEMPVRPNIGAEREKPGHKGNIGAKSTDLESMLISLLRENPKGMSLKALEKAVGDAIPNSVRKIEPIIKKIATFQAPGRYFLKQGMELENLKKPLSDSGSSPEDNCNQTLTLDDKPDESPAPALNFTEKTGIDELEKQTHLHSNIGEELNPSQKNVIQRHSPDLFVDKKVSDNNEEPAGSSSDSGSDSESDSDSSDSGSDSGSHSRSRSKSRSPVGSGSGSGSSSDSESDASSNSKQGPDEDVDIMTSDDEKESKPKGQISEMEFSSPPIQWGNSDGPVQNGIDEKQDGDGSDVVEIEKDLPEDDQEIDLAGVGNSISNKGCDKPLEDIGLSSPDHQGYQGNQFPVGNLFSERESIAQDGFKHEQADNSVKMLKGKSKRSSDSKHLYEKSEHAKKLKSGNLPQTQVSRGKDPLLLESPEKLSPDRVPKDPYKGYSAQVMNTAARDRNADSSLSKGCNQGIPGKSVLDSQNSGRKPVDLSARIKAPESAERPGLHAEGFGFGTKYSERNRQSHGCSSIQKDKASRETQDGDYHGKEKKTTRNTREGAFGDKNSLQFDSHHGKHDEPDGKFKGAEEISNSHKGHSPKDNNKIDVERSPVINGRGKMLQRELSDLELGELRETLPEETPGKKEFERKSSFKQSVRKSSSSDYWNSDLCKAKPTGKATVDSGRPSPPHVKVGTMNNLEGLSKRRSPEHHAEELTRTHHRGLQSQPQGPQPLSRVDRLEGVTHKFADGSGRSRNNEDRAAQGIGLEGYGDTHKKASANVPQQHDNNRGTVSHSMKGSKPQKSNALAEIIDIRKDTSLTESNDGGLKRRESSSDENSCSYSKYDKKEPELKGPIKNESQFEEYAREYREKYESYCSLNKILESYRNEFLKLGRDLDNAKGRDMEKYYHIVGQIRESYHQCGARHLRLKNIFVVLHRELQHLKQMMNDYSVSRERD